MASGEQTADAVREVCSQLWTHPMLGSGWKVAIVNEADRMSQAAETIWLDRLEELPSRSVVVFTTNHPEKLSQRLADRCLAVGFESRATVLAPAACELLGQASRRAGLALRPGELAELVRRATLGEKLSFRRVLQLLDQKLLVEGVA